MNDLAETAEGSKSTRGTDLELLAIYLQDHHAAGVAGVRLARRVGSRARGGHDLARVANEIAEDLRTLERIMSDLGVDARRSKDTIATVAGWVGRLKPNGRLVGRSPLSDLLELETLVVGINGKQALWHSLATVPAVAGEELERLLVRAEDQKRRVEAERLAAARRAWQQS